MKTKVTITGVKEIKERLLKVARAGIESDETLKEVGNIVQKSIVGAARSGKDPEGNKFTPLSKSWIERKQKLSSVNTTSSFYSKSRSNITFTGQLLDSFKFVINKSQLSLRFFFDGVRKPYRGLRKAELDGIETNKELAARIEETRPFVILSKKAEQMIIILVKRKIRQQLSNFKKLSRILK